MDVADPEALPHTDQSTHGQADQNGGNGGNTGLIQQLGTQSTNQTHSGADGKVNVTTGQDTQQHTTGQNQNIGVLQQQVRHVLGLQQTALGQDREKDEYQYQGNNHGILFQSRLKFHSVTPSLSSFFSDFRMAAMIFS